MARHIHSRLKVEGALTTETALHVGGLGESPDTDLPLARNGRGEFYIPGTSITGVIRSWCEKNFDKEEIKKLFGYQKEESGQASLVIVEDIAFKNIQEEIRDGVDIDRVYGTAADKAKFDRAIVPRGTELLLKITVEVESNAEVGKVKNIFGHLLGALRRGEIRFGASRTRGLGKVKLTKLKKVEEHEMSKILEWLNSSGSTQDFTDDSRIQEEIKNLTGESSAPTNQLLTITVNWVPKSPVMVKAGYDGVGVDTLPLVSGNGNGRVSLCLPGSSIKGAFRAQAERIVRTLKPEKFPRENDFYKQIKVEIVDELFGAKKEKTGQANHLGLGTLSVDDCYATTTFDSAVWNEVEAGELKDNETYRTQSLWKSLKKIDGDKKDDSTSFNISHHVAIDRWTGGASEGALYSVLQPTAKIGWQVICLTLDLSRLPDESLKKKCLMLLLLVLRDFAESRLPLGFTTNRGMGEVVVKEIKGLDKIPKLIGLEGEPFEAEIKDERLIFKGDKVKEALKGVLSNE